MDSGAQSGRIPLVCIAHIGTTWPSRESAAYVRPAAPIRGIPCKGPIYPHLNTPDGGPDRARVIDCPAGDCHYTRNSCSLDWCIDKDRWWSGNLDCHLPGSHVGCSVTIGRHNG